MNVNLHSSPYQAEVGGPVNEFLNSEFSTLCTIADQTPWSEKSSAQACLLLAPFPASSPTYN